MLCNTLQHAAIFGGTLSLKRVALKHTATRCNTLQHTATHCNILQHVSLQRRRAVISQSVLHNLRKGVCFEKLFFFLVTVCYDTVSWTSLLGPNWLRTNIKTWFFLCIRLSQLGSTNLCFVFFLDQPRLHNAECILCNLGCSKKHTLVQCVVQRFFLFSFFLLQEEHQDEYEKSLGATKITQCRIYLV